MIISHASTLLLYQWYGLPKYGVSMQCIMVLYSLMLSSILFSFSSFFFSLLHAVVYPFIPSHFIMSFKCAPPSEAFKTQQHSHKHELDKVQ